MPTKKVTKQQPVVDETNNLLEKAVEVKSIVEASPEAISGGLDFELTLPAGWLNITSQGNEVVKETSTWKGGHIMSATHQHAKGNIKVFSGWIKDLEKQFNALYPQADKRPQFWVDNKYNPLCCKVGWRKGAMYCTVA